MNSVRERPLNGIIRVWNLDGRPVEKPPLVRSSATLAHRRSDIAVHHHLARSVPAILSVELSADERHCWHL